VTSEITRPYNRSYTTVLRQIDGTNIVYKAYQQSIGKVLGSNSEEDEMYE
jgi:hypothetical protein